MCKKTRRTRSRDCPATPPRPLLQALKQAGGVYLRRRVLLMLLLGFSAGLPLALSGSTLVIWMTQSGVSLSTIGLFSLAGLPYTLKFLWAPAIDALHIPFFSRTFGRRRGWLLFSQLALMVSIFALGSLDPTQNLQLIALGAIVVATFSATQDIVIDAFRVESLEKNQQAAGMAYYVSAYRTAWLIASVGTIFIVHGFEKAGVSRDLVWFYGYAVAALMMLVGMLAVLLSKEPDPHLDTNLSAQQDGKDNTLAGLSAFARFRKTATTAFRDFLTKPYVLAILGFVVVFKFCDALAGAMTAPFILDLGFSKETYAAVGKGVGFGAAILGSFVGGALARTVSMARGLWIAGLLQMASNLMFIWLAYMGADHGALVATMFAENFAGGIGTVIYIAYLSGLCSNDRHTATQFALLTALSAVGRTVFSAASGYMAEFAGWPVFFALTTAFALPAFLLLAFLQHKGHFNETTTNKNRLTG